VGNISELYKGGRTHSATKRRGIH